MMLTCNITRDGSITCSANEELLDIGLARSEPSRLVDCLKTPFMSSKSPEDVGDKVSSTDSSGTANFAVHSPFASLRVYN
jgi:hypothetical protein